jgi:predicted DCC family thiol-disulfide oxidoreductase YuxK
MKRAKQAALLYDSECCFCRWATAKVLAWDRRGRLRAVRLQDREAQRLLPRMNEEARMASWHLVTPDGKVRSAGAAAGPLFRLLPGGRVLAAVASAFPRTTERAYQWVARNRDRLARRLGEQACETEPDR